MRFVKLLHKWLGLIVGLQLLLWTTSGLMFAWLNHHEVAGEHSTRQVPAPTLTSAVVLVEPGAWIEEYAAADIRDIRLMPLLAACRACAATGQAATHVAKVTPFAADNEGVVRKSAAGDFSSGPERWVYRIELSDRVELRRAENGERFVIDAPLARELALASYAGGGNLVSVVRRDEPTLEARDAGPVWRADFDDSAHTSLYLSAADGRFVAARNDTWRLFDFFWMLHTMDYRGRDNFNNPLAILAASCALWLALSGVLLLSRSFRWQALNPLARWRPPRSRAPRTREGLADRSR